jgi:hypothetical protein
MLMGRAGKNVMPVSRDAFVFENGEALLRIIKDCNIAHRGH